MAGDYSGSQHTITWKGDVQTQDGEIILNGTDAYGQIPDSSDFDFPGDYTIEFFGVKFLDKTVAQVMFSKFTTSAAGFLLSFRGEEATPNLRWTIANSGFTSTNSDSYDPDSGVAQDVTIERSGNDLRFYANGSMISKHTLSVAPGTDSTDVLVGAEDPASPKNFWEARFAALRITPGTARYADDGGYTVPDLPLPTEGPA